MFRHSKLLAGGLTAVFTLALSIFMTACASTTPPPPTVPLPTVAKVAVVMEETAVLPTATATTIPPSPIPTETATATATPAPTATALPSPTPLPADQQINGVPASEFIIMPLAVQAHVREIYALGQELGRDPQAFSKLGDSSMASPNFLLRMGQRTFDLADYAALQEVIDTYQISYRRLGPTTVVGLHATSVFVPDLLNLEMCDPAQDGNMLDCEFRLHNPSILLIGLGTNDESDLFQARMEKIVSYSMERGIIPVLFTKADRYEGDDNRNNIAIREIAAAYELPLLDFDRLAQTLPARGMGKDSVHLTEYEYYEYRSPEAFTYGYAILNLSTTMMLDALQEVLATAE